MKKQIFILSAIALATASAQAYPLLKSEQTGTTVDFTGSARIVWKSTSHKNQAINGESKKEHINHAVANNGSRFGFKIKQDLGLGAYALGNVEWRFRGTSSSQHDFDDIYTCQLFAGIGHAQYGELTYGNMTTITDEVKQTDLGNTLSLSDGLLVGSARKVAQYTYKGIEGLKLGGFFGGKSKRNMAGLNLHNQRKDVWGLAAIYNGTISSGENPQSIKIGTGVTRERAFNSGTNNKFDRTAYSLGTAYTIDRTTLGIDLERAITHDQGQIGNKRTQSEVRSVLKHKLTDNWAAYTMYAYKTDKLIAVSDADNNVKKHQFMVGTEYSLAPNALIPAYFKQVKTFAEVATSRAKHYSNREKVAKIRDNAVAVGLRIFW
ncbi:porin [Vespertiliibacter pulmonis]|uniref:Putative porin n=1 Tax=Vespertiliibacter pulmonis TaxID=1443036 RepID=A0A3N4VI06_9PAST|nr:porin [Vespertiliibacter pulmonis]QLB20553.1 porin [Vespertiliibacter pulmonis]RPE82682.1 putative porin [Vespertiliibacter pulmonis]